MAGNTSSVYDVHVRARWSDSVFDISTFQSMESALGCGGTSMNNLNHSKGFIQRCATGDHRLAACGFTMALLILPLLLAWSLETRTVLDANVWVKPIKFCVALSVYALTLSFFASFLSDNYRQSRTYVLFTKLVLISIALEIIWLIYASAIGEASHFNNSHPILVPLYSLMGILATILTGMSLAVAWGYRHHVDSALTQPVRISIILGLVLTFVLTLTTASYMASSDAQSHTVLAVGQTLAVATTTKVPFFGWSMQAGDLRVSHFFATHALHAVPLIGWLVGKVLPGRSGVAIVALVAIAYAVFVGFTFLQALNGQPFLSYY